MVLGLSHPRGPLDVGRRDRPRPRAERARGAVRRSTARSATAPRRRCAGSCGAGAWAARRAPASSSTTASADARPHVSRARRRSTHVSASGLPPFQRFLDAHRDVVWRFLVVGGRPRRGRGLLPGDVHRGAARLPAPAPGLQPARVGADDRPPQGARRAPRAGAPGAAGGRRRRRLDGARAERAGAGAGARRGAVGGGRRAAGAPALGGRAALRRRPAPSRDRDGDRLLGGGGAALAARGT